MLGYEASQPPSNRARIQERTTWEKTHCWKEIETSALGRIRRNPTWGKHTTMWNPQRSITAPLSEDWRKSNCSFQFRTAAALLLHVRRSIASTNATHLFNIINIGLPTFKSPSTCDWCRSRLKSSRVPHVIFAFKELNSTASQQINTVSRFEMDNTYC